MSHVQPISEVNHRFIFATDWHASGIRPRRRRDDYHAALLAKLEWMILKAKDIGASNTIIGGGDIFNTPNVSLEIVDDIADLFSKHNMTLATIFGNHDLSSSLSTAHRTVLGHLMRRSPKHFTPLPLLTDRVGFKIGPFEIWGHHYVYQNHLNDLLVNPTNSEVRVIVSHSMILKDKPVFEDYTLFNQVVTNAHLVLLGHFHQTQDMTRLNNDYSTLIGGPGALMRGTISRDDLTRVPSVALVDYNKGDVKVTYLPIEVARPSAEVFDLEQAKAEEQQEASLESFRQDLGDLKVQGLNVASVIESIATANNISEEVKNEALRRIGVL